MIILAARIPEEGLHLAEEESPEILGLEEDPVFCAAGPVRCELYVQLVSGSLLVRGTVSAEVSAHCARCTQIFSTTVADSGFLRDYSGIHGTEEVDITEEIREAVMLNLPHFPLCAERCRGLCAHCGKNLNEGLCGCAEAGGDGAWNALDNLKL